MSEAKEPPDGTGSTSPDSGRSRRAFQPLEWVGPYRILEYISHGGFGEVYAAEQHEPVRRRVALKVLMAGMDTRSVLARFEAERQALALMDHPNIAKIFDAGETKAGRPYFVMEYVPGIPITEHCDRHRLSTRERLELFIQVCEAIQHAHEKAVIHRDVKPSNILVVIQGNRPVPKVIDFGVAKALSQPLTERTLFTAAGQLIGTPAYMSPEQAEMTSQGIDTRTDVYALGTVLYELLAGSPPFDPRTLIQGGIEGILRVLREEEPPRPSTRVSSSQDADAAEVARNRHTDPPRLTGQLRGDLDWITMKALEKDRTRRYGTPAALAADVQRHMTHQPVVAGPPGTAYRVGKFVRRHRVGVAFAGAVALFLLGFAVREHIQSRRIAAERDRANQEAETARQLAGFLVEAFRVPDPGEKWAQAALGKTMTAREILDQGADRVLGTLEDQPLVRARLMATMGEVYGNLGLYPQAARLASQALDLQRQLLGDRHPETLRSATMLASIFNREGRYAEAESLASQTLDARRAALGARSPETLRAMLGLGNVYASEGRYKEAEAFHGEALRTARSSLGDTSSVTLSAMHDLATVYVDEARFDAAESLFVATLAVRRRTLGIEHPETLKSANNLAATYRAQGRYREAESLYGESLASMKRVLGDEHPETLKASNNLGNVYTDMGQYDDAADLLAATLETCRRTLGADHPLTLISANNFARARFGQHRTKEAASLFRQSMEGKRRLLGVEHMSTLQSMTNLASVYASLGRYEEAEPLHRETVEIMRRVLGPEHVETLGAVNNLADTYCRMGRYAEAESLLVETVGVQRRVLGEQHPDVRLSLYNLAALMALQGKRDGMLRYLLEALDAGFAEDWILEDSEFEAFRDDPGLQAITDEVRRRAEASR